MLTVTVRTVVLEIHPTPLSVTVGGSVTGLPVIDAVTMSLGVDGTGLAGWSAQVGPAAIDIGGPILRPFVRVDYATSGGWQADVGLGLDALGPTDVGHQELIARWRQASGLAVLVTNRTSVSNVAEDTVPRRASRSPRSTRCSTSSAAGCSGVTRSSPARAEPRQQDGPLRARRLDPHAGAATHRS